jgi:hypothetical protein
MAGSSKMRGELGAIYHRAGILNPPVSAVVVGMPRNFSRRRSDAANRVLRKDLQKPTKQQVIAFFRRIAAPAASLRETLPGHMNYAAAHTA